MKYEKMLKERLKATGLGAHINFLGFEIGFDIHYFSRGELFQVITKDGEFHLELLKLVRIRAHQLWG